MVTTAAGLTRERQALMTKLSAPDWHWHEPTGDVSAKIRVRNLEFFYGAVRALKGVSVDLADRRVTALIGPSGCGKSTLIRVLNRMYDLYPDQRASGDVLLDGENILSATADVERLRTRVGMTFQKPVPLPLSIFGNIAFGPRLHFSLPRAELRHRVETALRRAALWDEVKDRLKDPAADLSGGQLQRLSIARAIALNPEVLLFDEPCAALDPISTLKIEDLLDELRRDYCIVIVTHNMEQAARVADYVGFMYLGELLEFGTAEKMFVHPDTRRARDYVTGRFG
jgi:phosphate transport system ATP-binding protein